MPLYVADYLADTGHLSAVEHGAYLMLIMHYWQKGGLPDNDRQLASIARVLPEQWADIRTTIAAFFDANWRHKRIEEERAKAEKKYQARVNAGKKGGEAKASNARAKSYQPQPQPHRKKEEAEASSSERAKTPREELRVVLDEEHAAAIVDHRQRMRKPITALGARKLATQFAKMPDPNAAADEMLANGWQGFKPEYLRPRFNGHSPPQRRGVVEVAFDKLAKGNFDGPESIFGNHGDVERLSAAGARKS